MNNNILCENCDLEFRIKHDASPELYPIKYCPFCGESLGGSDWESWYDIEEDVEDEEE